LEHGVLPWSDTTINGWVLDPDRKKMSKSKGNVVTPIEWLERYGSDAVRYWAACGRPGTDTAFDEGQMKIGRRLAIKILNASKFVLTVAAHEAGEVTEPLDQSLLVALADVIRESTTAFEGFDYARALERTERFFWSFCDDYLELVKGRAYGGAGEAAARSAATTLRIALSALLRLFAPILPFVTEEVWSWWQEGSIHRAAWPDAVTAAAGDPTVFAVAGDVLGVVRKEKSEQKVSLATPVDRIVVYDTAERLTALRAALEDVREAGKVAGDIDLEEGPELSVKVWLASAPDPDGA
jgi:valyl-tRNA synthetase